MNVIHEKNAITQPGKNLLHFLPVHRSPGRTLQPIQHAAAVAFCLQASDKPGPRVGQALVVQVHRVLCCQHDSQAVRSSLFQERQQGLFDGGLATGGK